MQFKVIVFIVLLISITRSESFGQCIGLDADAGPDLFTCDPTMMVQLMFRFIKIFLECEES